MSFQTIYSINYGSKDMLSFVDWVDKFLKSQSEKSSLKALPYMQKI
jgi:hypothetical protein